MAPAKVLHGAVRLHGLTSSPTPETHVRVAWAWAGAAVSASAKTKVIAVNSDSAADFTIFIRCLPRTAVDESARRNPRNLARPECRLPSGPGVCPLTIAPL